MITGKYIVKICKSALKEGKKLVNNAKDNFRLRHEILRLKDLNRTSNLDWVWLTKYSDIHVGEYKIKLQVGDNRNIRAFFWVDTVNKIAGRNIIWILSVWCKKDYYITDNDIRVILKIRNTLRAGNT